MVRHASVLLAAILVLSCAPPAYLVTDAPFRRAFPEITAAWQSLPFWDGARQADLASGGAGLPKLLASLPPGSPVLVGAALSDADRAASAGPRIRFVGPARAGSAALTVRRADAWALVATAAAAPGAAGWILFPGDAAEDEKAAVRKAWKAAAGTAAAEAQWPAAGTVAPPPAVLVDFAGPEADQMLLGAAAGRPIHGDPGLPEVPGTSPAVWRIRTADLGAFLLKTVRNSAENVEFLPLETAPPRR